MSDDVVVVDVGPATVLAEGEADQISLREAAPDAITDGVPDIVVVSQEAPAIVLDEAEETVLRDAINVPQGPTGPPGPPGEDVRYVHQQTIPATVWTVNHGLGKFAVVEVVDSADTRVFSAVRYVSANTVELEFSAPFAGRAFFS